MPNQHRTRMIRIRQAQLAYQFALYPMVAVVIVFLTLGGTPAIIGIGTAVVAAVGILVLVFRFASLHREVELRAIRLMSIRKQRMLR